MWKIKNVFEHKLKKKQGKIIKKFRICIMSLTFVKIMEGKHMIELSVTIGHN